MLQAPNIRSVAKELGLRQFFTIATGDSATGDNAIGDNATGDSTTGDNATGDNFLASKLGREVTKVLRVPSSDD